jgi:hypothetical protein
MAGLGKLLAQFQRGRDYKREAPSPIPDGTRVLQF